jgi:methenyltetrahydrofolate cyclohydrolase
MSNVTPWSRVPFSELQIREFLAALGERTPAPASGAATAFTAAAAAALVELTARFAGDEVAATRAKVLSGRLMQLADEDAAAYSAFMADKTDETRRRIIEVPEEIAANADEVAELAVDARAQLSSSVAGDAEAAAELATAAARVARRLADLNR